MRLLGAHPQRAAAQAAPKSISTACKETGKMADQQPTGGRNGLGGGDDQPQIGILAQYTKDLSVENPSSPQVFQWQVQPSIDVQFNINIQQVAEGVHEVALKIEVTAHSDSGVHFVVDLTYAGLFGLRNIAEEMLQPFLLIEAP